MKKDLKTEITREKIIQAAFEEFGMNGYDGASVNAVCARHNISKGLIYHNFKGKDEIYLICVERIIHALTIYLQDHLDQQLEAVDQLKHYLQVRKDFFQHNPWYLNIYCEVTFFSPTHLKSLITELKEELILLNHSIIQDLLADLKIREDIPQERLIKAFSHAFDFIDALSQRNEHHAFNDKELFTLDILLYGLIQR